MEDSGLEENTYNHEYIWIEDCYFHDITDKDEPIGGGRNGRPVTPDLIYGMGVSICGADALEGEHCFRILLLRNVNLIVVMWELK